MKLKLRIENKGLESNLELDSRSQCLIGRSGADVLLDDPKCSRSHCLIFEGENGTLHLRDLESSNGTFVNGKRITESPLNLKDEVRIGASRLWVIEYTPQAQPDNHSETTHGGQDKELLSQWPDMMRSLPTKSVGDFIDHIDDEQRKKSVRLQDIIKKRKQGE